MVKKCLQLGCGGNILEDWENHDEDVDITKPLPFEDQTYDYIMMEHVLEHISGPESLRCLQECFRILRKGGKIRICVPVLDHLSTSAAIDIVVNHGHKVVMSYGILGQLLGLAGFQFIHRSDRKEWDGHWKIIGKEKDDLETLRVEAMRPC
jgi:ubiquinone/menaquinone biosynthesis C-methylase UbiE